MIGSFHWRRWWPPTLLGYLARCLSLWFLAVLAAVAGLVFTADVLQLSFDEGAQFGVGFDSIVALALLKLPQTVMQVVPFAVLISGLIAFRQLARSSELIVARSVGVSVWQFLLPAIGIALAIAVIRVAAIDPIATAMAARYEAMRATLFGEATALSIASGSGFWLRETSDDGTLLMRADRVDLGGQVFGVTVMLLDADDRFASRIDAASGRAIDAAWQFETVRLTEARRGSQFRDRHVIASRVTFDELIDRFAKTNSLSFWDLPQHIATMEQTGFSARPHRLLWHRFAAMPLLYGGMMIIAIAFAVRLHRAADTPLLIGAGALTGFLLYFFSDLIYALGINSSIPLALAAWTPAGIAAIFGATLLLYLEDG